MTDELWAALAAQVDQQVRGRSDYGQIVTALSSEDQHTIVAAFDTDDDGGLDPLSCRWEVRVAVPDGWATIARVPWQRLPLSLDDLRDEHAWAQVQYELGKPT